MHSTSAHAGNMQPAHHGDSHQPPYTQEQQDAQLVALHFAYAMLAKALHAEGVLDLSDLAGELGNAQWVFQGRPAEQSVVADLAADLRYMRAKQGEPGRGQG